jgi:hypothetical protein
MGLFDGLKDAWGAVTPWTTKHEKQKFGAGGGNWGAGNYSAGDMFAGFARFNPLVPGPLAGAAGKATGWAINSLTGQDGNFTGSAQETFNPDNAYMELGDPEDVTNVNPYSDPFMQQLREQGGNTWNQLNQGMGNMTGMINSLDPMAAQRAFLGQEGAMRGIAEQNYDQFNTANRAVADRLSQQAVDNISGHFGDTGPGALRSGAAAQAISEGAINPILQSNAQIGQMIGGQAGQLQGQNMSNLFTQMRGYDQMGLNAQQGLNQLMGGMYGQQLGQRGQMARPEWWQPTYMPNPNYMSPQEMIGTGADIAGMALPFL